MLEFDRALASSEFLCALNERRFHRLATDHDHEVFVPDALEDELRQLVEVLLDSARCSLLLARMSPWE